MASSNEGQSFFLKLWQRAMANPSTPRIATAAACFLLIFAVTINDLANPRSANLIVGDVARKDYIAPYSAVYVDTEATYEVREAAASQVNQVFSIDNATNNSMTSDLANFFLRLNELAGELRLVGQLDTENISGAEVLEDVELMGEQGVTFDSEQAEAAAIAELTALLNDNLLIGGQLIDVIKDDDFRELLYAETTIRGTIDDVIDRSIRERIIDLIHVEAIPQVLDDLRASIADKSEKAGLTISQARLASRLAGYFIRPNSVPDEAATETARDVVRDATPPVQREVRAGQIFLRAGELVDQEDLDIMAALGMLGAAEYHIGWLTIALFALVLAIAFTLSIVYLPGKGFTQFNDSRYYLLFYTILTITYLTTFFIIQLLRAGTQSDVMFAFASLPIISGAVLFSHYFTRLAAITVSGFLAVLLALASGEQAILLPAIFPAIATALFIKRDCPKPLMIRAIIYLPLIWAVSLFAMATTSMMDMSILRDRYWYLLTAIAPAPVAMLLANYVLDAAFNIPTTSRLQEFDNQDHPLLKKLQLEAPGTWHHSMMIRMIAEAACQAIGANVQLVRVASLFHDIGKTRRPEFFIENQRGGINVHDKYSPWLSKIIVEGHVKDGIALAKAHGLPQELIDAIPQHHGTSMITYFFRKALAMSEDGYVNEYDYRYPGPKPQTPEAVCISIADAAESSTRSLEEPTPHRIESLVNKIYEERLLDGQFDECGLALNQLETIKTVIIGRLIGAYHTRIDYPEEEELRRQLQLKRAEGDKNAKPEAPDDID